MKDTRNYEYKGDGFFKRHRAFLNNPLPFALERSRDVGDFFYTRMLLLKIFFLTNPEGIRHVFQTNQKNYKKSPAYDQLKLALGNGLVTSEGDFWRKQRRLAQPAFHRKRMENLFEVMGEVAEEYIADLTSRTRKKSIVNIPEEMMGVTANIVLKTLFHSDNYENRAHLHKAMTSSQEYIMDCIHHPFLVPLTFINGKRRRFFKDLSVFEDQVKSFIEERRNSDNPPQDLLTMLMEARDEDTGEGMSDRQLRDEAMTIFAAGHETSANALSWTLYLLSKHPDILAKLRTEIEEVAGDRRPSFTDLRNMPYSLQVLEEGMRMYPPAWAIGRQAIDDDEILGVPVPRKSVIFVSVHALHHNPEFWEQPEVFNPDRFAPEEVKKRSRWHYMPFGAGPRMCIGNNFALMEMQLLLTMLVRRFDFKLLPGQKIEMHALITLKPRYGIKMEMAERES